MWYETEAQLVLDFKFLHHGFNIQKQMSSKKAHITDDPTFVVVSLKKKCANLKKNGPFPLKT